MILVKVSTSDSRIEPDLAQARNIPVERRSSTMVDTITLWPEDSIPFAYENSSACCSRMAFCLSKFHPPAGELSCTKQKLSTS